MTLGETIEERIRDSARHVEVAIFGTPDAEEIAQAVDGICLATLGARIRAYRFYRSSIASVHGVELDDGRIVVVKAYQPRVAVDHLLAVIAIQRRLADTGFPCARPLTKPVALRRGTLVIEEELTCGEWHDGHDPAFRDALAAGLAELIARCRSLPTPDALELDHFLSVRREQLWPEPHSELFDFESTREGAEPIDEVARAARQVLRDADVRRLVVGHVDWRAENARFDGERLCAVYDWESLRRTSEPMNVGGASLVFASDWDRRPAGDQVASIDEARAFVSAYEEARGAGFSPDERRILGAAAAYAASYVARCAHAADPAGQDEAGEGFRTLVHQQGTNLLRIFLD